MTAYAEDGYVFDTGPLMHFARAGWLGALKFVIDPAPAFAPEAVRNELKRHAAQNSELHSVLKDEWLRAHDETDPSFLALFVDLAERLADADGHNLGECGVLALAKSTGYTAVIDDRVAREAAKSTSVKLTGTLGLLVKAAQEGRLTVEMISSLCDDLIRTHYRLPFGPGEFVHWAKGEGLL
jgi:hypothetical protein